MGDGADVQKVGHTHRQHLTELPVERVRPPEPELRKAAGGAGEPGEEGGGREEDLRHVTSSVQRMVIDEDGCSAHSQTCPSMLCVQAESALYRLRARAQPYW